MRKHKLRIWMACLCTVFCMCVMPNLDVKASMPQYEIVFKAGLHGTINNEKSVSYPVTAGDIFPNEPMVSAEAGYVFKGWNKQLPGVGSSVEGKQTYVAQYDVLVSGVNYIVRYVNEDNVEIATPKSTMAESGSTIHERAKIIAGYTYQTAEQQFVVNEQTTSFTFVYTLTNPDEVIRYEQEVINQETPQQGGNQNDNNANNDANNNETEDNTPGNDTPADNEIVDDNETPLANSNPQSDNGLLIVGGCGILLVVILLGLFLRKKKNNAVNKG